MNFPFFVSLNVRSFDSIRDFIVTLFLIVSEVCELITEMSYFPGFKSTASFPTPLALVLMEYVLPFSLIFTWVFLSSFPFLS